MSMKSKISLGIFGVVILFTFILSGQIIENNKAGYYQVKQAAISGELTVKMTAGWYGQFFGDITTYKQVATVGFGSEKGEGSADIGAVDVQFNDGSLAKISGMVRVVLPTDPDKLIVLKNKYASGYEHFIRSGIVPMVTNAIKLSANLRSAQDAYTTLALLQQAVDDQLRNGIYKTRSDVKEIVRSNGDVEKTKLTEIVKDKNGIPVRVSNILAELGCSIDQCVLSVPDFDNKVKEMISKRKDEAMKTELAKQAAIRAQQDRLTIEEQGKADVMKVKYKMEEEKIAAVVTAKKEKEVAELDARKKLEVAKLDKLAAREYKAKKIYQAEADATYKRKVMVADGALAQKLKTYEAVQARWAEAIQKSGVNWVPQIIMGGGSKSKGGNGAQALIELLGVKAAKELALDMSINKNK